MASITLHPRSRAAFETLRGDLAARFPDAHVEAAASPAFESYRLDVSCDSPALEAWVKSTGCPKT